MYNGYIYEATIYEELITAADLTNGEIFTLGVQCAGFPLYDTVCISECDNQFMDWTCSVDCSSCGGQSCSTSGECLKCDSDCNDLCAENQNCFDLNQLSYVQNFSLTNSQRRAQTDCTQNCELCQVETCVVCNLGYYFTYDNQCVISCGLEYYEQNNYCYPCYNSCQVCTGPDITDCQDCSDENATLVSGSCICHQGFYQSPNYPYICSPCSGDCLTCSVQNICQFCRVDNSSPVFGVCECIAGYYPSSTDPLVCMACNEDCSNCIQQDECIECKAQNSYVVQGKCVCDSGFFKSSSNPMVCTVCNSDCSECQLENQCSSCADSNSTPFLGICRCNSGYYSNSTNPLICEQCGILSTGCPQCLDPNSSLVQGFCLCDQHYYSFTTDPLICLPCLPECQTCLDGQSCIECPQTTMSLIGNICECNPGFYKDLSETKICLECASNCKTCDGPLENNCVLCPDNAQLFNGSCMCDQGFQEVTTNPLVCGLCNAPCLTCQPQEKSYCLTCRNSNLIAIEGECICRPGYFISDLTCIPCHFSCSTCSGSEPTDCLTCSSLNSQLLQGQCECEKGYYADDSSVCMVCPTKCQSCKDQNTCISCKYSYKSASDNCTSCARGYCPKGDACQECVYSPESAQQTTEGVILSRSVESAMVIGFVSMLTIDDPTVLWTISNISQILSYLPVLSLNLSNTLYSFLRSYQTMGFLPNLFQDIIQEQDNQPPQNFVEYGWTKNEYKDTNFFRNCGRHLLMISIITGIYLFLLIFSMCLCQGCIKRKIKGFSFLVLRFLIKIFFQFQLDFGVAASLSTYYDNYTSSTISVIFAVIFFDFLIISPLILLLTLKYSARIRNKDETIMRYLGSLFSSINLESKYGLFYESVLALRRTIFALSIFLLYDSPLIPLIILFIFSILIAVFLYRGKVFASKNTSLINILSELVLSISILLICVSLLWRDNKIIDYFVMGINIFFIIFASIINIVVKICKCLCRKKKINYLPARKPTIVIEIGQNQDNGVFIRPSNSKLSQIVQKMNQEFSQNNNRNENGQIRIQDSTWISPE